MLISNAIVQNPILLAAGEPSYSTLVVLLVVALGVTIAVQLLTHLIGPQRRGPIKDSTYESGVDPIGDTRRRFNVRFYVIAMLFLLFDVEIVFFYPWGVLFPRMHMAEYSSWAGQMRDLGFGVWFFVIEMLIFMAILTIGYVYAWRKGVFRWD